MNPVGHSQWWLQGERSGGLGTSGEGGIRERAEPFVLLLGRSLVTFYREPQRPSDSAPVNREGCKRLGE